MTINYKSNGEGKENWLFKKKRELSSRRKASEIIVSVPMLRIYSKQRLVW